LYIIGSGRIVKHNLKHFADFHRRIGHVAGKAAKAKIIRDLQLSGADKRLK
jgi:hypothetical protein